MSDGLVSLSVTPDCDSLSSAHSPFMNDTGSEIEHRGDSIPTLHPHYSIPRHFTFPSHTAEIQLLAYLSRHHHVPLLNIYSTVYTVWKYRHSEMSISPSLLLRLLRPSYLLSQLYCSHRTVAVVKAPDRNGLLFNLFMFRLLGKQAVARHHTAMALITIATTLFMVTLYDWLQYLSEQHNSLICHSQVTHHHRPSLPRARPGATELEFSSDLHQLDSCQYLQGANCGWAQLHLTRHGPIHVISMHSLSFCQVSFLTWCQFTAKIYHGYTRGVKHTGRAPFLKKFTLLISCKRTAH